MEAKLFFPFERVGWDVQSVQPRRWPAYRVAGAIMRGEDGNELPAPVIDAAAWAIDMTELIRARRGRPSVEEPLARVGA